MIDTQQQYINQNIHGEISICNSRGVAIWIKKNIEFKLIDEYKDNEGRLLLINVEINNAIYSIINIYAPNNMKKRNTFFKQIDRFINEYSIGQLILAGDYNDILSKIEKKKKYINQRNLINQSIT
jgi:exonuclease III